MTICSIASHIDYQSWFDMSSLRNSLRFLSSLLALYSGFAAQAVQAEEVALDEVRIASIRDPQWISYKTAYKAMQIFEAYDKPKDLLRPVFTLIPKETTRKLSGLELRLVGDSTSEKIDVANLWGTIPMRPEALDDNAEFVLNHPAGSFEFRRIMAIALNPTGTYKYAYLQAGCNQVLEFIRHMNIVERIRFSGKKCVGVKLVYPGSHSGIAAVDKPVGESESPLSEGHAEAGNKALQFRFHAGSAEGEIVALAPIVAIVALIE